MVLHAVIMASLRYTKRLAISGFSLGLSFRVERLLVEKKGRGVVPLPFFYSA
jgi:hypothetical protein